MQLFLAIDLPTESKKNLFEQLKDLRLQYADINWIPQESYHLTLLFLGEIENDRSKLKNIKEIIERILFKYPVFYLYSLHAGLFIKNRINIYLEFAREKNLERIVEEMRETFQTNKGKIFIPHVSFANYRVPSKQQYLLLKKKIQNTSFNIEFPVKKLALFQTVAEGRKNPVYKKIKEFTLFKQ